MIDLDLIVLGSSKIPILKDYEWINYIYASESSIIKDVILPDNTVTLVVAGSFCFSISLPDDNTLSVGPPGTSPGTSTSKSSIKW